jgi:hypothetical protein
VDFHVTLAFGLQIVGAGFLISWDLGLPPPEAPRPVCGFSCDTCLRPPNCWGRLPDFMGPWPSSHRGESAWASSNPCGGECRSSTLDAPYINSMACGDLHNGKPQTAEVWRERSLSEVSQMWYWKS